MKSEREAVDQFARDILNLISRLRPVLEGSPTPWPASRSRLAADISRDLVQAVAALDVAVMELYFQVESLESAHLGLEVERKAYQELFDAGPDGLLVTDPRGVILRANKPVGALFACNADDLVGEMLPTLMRAARLTHGGAGGALQGDWTGEWIGEAVPAKGPPFRLAMTVAVVPSRGRNGVSLAMVSARHQPPYAGRLRLGLPDRLLPRPLGDDFGPATGGV